jgi:hypothetical protein
MEEKEKPVIDTRPFFMSYENNKWVLNIKDPKTEEVIEKRVALNGRWSRLGNVSNARKR